MRNEGMAPDSTAVCGCAAQALHKGAWPIGRQRRMRDEVQPEFYSQIMALTLAASPQSLFLLAKPYL